MVGAATGGATTMEQALVWMAIILILASAVWLALWGHRRGRP